MNFHNELDILQTQLKIEKTYSECFFNCDSLENTLENEVKIHNINQRIAFIKMKIHALSGLMTPAQAEHFGYCSFNQAHIVNFFDAISQPQLFAAWARGFRNASDDCMDRR